ncbi:MAG: stage II sporulation protein M [Bacilli bacterium]
MKKLINKRLVVGVSIVLFIGIIFGLIFPLFINDLDKLNITSLVKEYITKVELKDITFNIFLSSFTKNFIIILILCISSFIFLLFPLTLFLNFYKGFLIGFYFSSLIITLKFKGLLYGLLGIFPHEIIIIALTIILSSISLNFNLKLYNCVKTNDNLNLRIFLKKVSIIFIISIIICTIASILEIYLNTYLIHLF